MAGVTGWIPLSASTMEEEETLLWQGAPKDPILGWDSNGQLTSPRYLQFSHSRGKQSLWIHGWHPSLWVSERLNSTESVIPTGDPGQRSGNSTVCVALPARIQDQGAAFVASLRSCTKNKDLHKGQAIHDDILKRGLLVECADALMTMYAKCGELGKAKALLDMHKSSDVITWTAIIAGYVRIGQGQDAIDCFECMRHEGIPPNAVTYASVLKACASIGALEKGTEIHDEVARQGLQDNMKLGTAFVDMYAKCGCVAKAHDVLNKLSSRDVVTWNALICGYAQEGQGEKALDCFDCMQQEGIRPDEVTYLTILKACASIGAVDRGKEVHDVIARQGLLQDNLSLGSALVDMYTKCGALSKAQAVLDTLPSRNVVFWSALIAGYAQAGHGEKALKCYEHMQSEGILPNAVTYTCILKACAIVGAVEKGEQIHDEIARQGLLKDDVVLGSSLVHMYAKCGALSKAEIVLENLPVRDVISWNALIAGYVQEDQGEQAINCFTRMKCEGISPDEVTYACILKACAMMGAIDMGKHIHDEIARQGLLQDNIVLGNCLVDMYAKCGDLSKAHYVLGKLPFRNVVSWSALMAGYIQEGQGEQVFICFERMQQEGITPNIVTFGCVLNACSHLGLVEEGHAFFVDMSTKYGLKANIECYTCMIDLFGRAGHLDKAVQLIQKMPSCECSELWLTLLSACQKWGDINVGKCAFEQAIKMDESDGPAYVLMANIYAAAGMHRSAEEIKTMRNKAWKKTGHNWCIQ